MHLTARFQTHLEPTNSSFLHPRSEAKKTKVKKKTNNPHFDEVFYFEVGVSVGRTLSLGTKTVSKSQFEPPDCLNLSHLTVSGAVQAQPRDPQIWMAFESLVVFLLLRREKPHVSS